MILVMFYFLHTGEICIKTPVMKILIIYGTTEGQTRKVADFLKTAFEAHSHTVTLCDATAAPPSPVGFDVVIIGASMHMERYQDSVLHYIREHHAALNTSTSAFYSVSLTAAADDQASWGEIGVITDHFLKAGGWQPKVIEFVAGALRYAMYDFFKKFIMRQIAARNDPDAAKGMDKEYTNWEALSLFAARMERLAASAPVTVCAEESDFEAVC